MVLHLGSWDWSAARWKSGQQLCSAGIQWSAKLDLFWTELLATSLPRTMRQAPFSHSSRPFGQTETTLNFRGWNGVMIQGQARCETISSTSSHMINGQRPPSLSHLINPMSKVACTIFWGRWICSMGEHDASKWLQCILILGKSLSLGISPWTIQMSVEHFITVEVCCRCLASVFIPHTKSDASLLLVCLILNISRLNSPWCCKPSIELHTSRRLCVAPNWIYPEKSVL